MSAKSPSSIRVVVLATLFALLGSGCFSAFSEYKCRSKQAEAQTNLRILADAMKAEKDQSGSYPTDLSAVRTFQPEGKYYAYEITKADAETFEARAVGKDSMKGDVWSISPDGQATVVTNLCR